MLYIINIIYIYNKNYTQREKDRERSVEHTPELSHPQGNRTSTHWSIFNS